MAKILNIEIDDEIQKALEWDIVDLDIWVSNAIFNKARICAGEICRQAIEDKTHTILSLEDKQLLRQYLDNQGIIITSVKHLPDNIKREIVKRANIVLAKDRPLPTPGG